MVHTHPIGKRPCPPAFHPCRQRRDHVDSAAFERHVSTNLLETRSPEHLTRTRDVLSAAERIVVGDAVFAEGTTRYAKLWIHGELAQQKLEEVRNERKVGIEAADDVEIKVCDRLESGIEGK